MAGERNAVEVEDPPALNVLPAIREPADLVHVASIAHPLSIDRTTSMVQAGPTIADLIRMAGVPPWAHVRVYLDGDLVYPEFYHVVRPKRGSHVVIRAVPRGGGGGGGSSKNIGMLIVGILLIVVGVLVAIYGDPAIGGYIIGAGVSLTLSAIINILIPPPTPPRLRPLSGLSASEAESPTLSIAGQKNSMRPYGVVPRVIGRHRVILPA